ncbi:PLP-dependent cysteine synthase family protein [Marinobacter salinisoli]|uniref:L-cysteine desulfhydrase Cds1 n=1 Tax=Marinobacter salinisoli TaxID=2769486 RepID=A0ABX7MSW9_9GAMM|nr:PLP-dependent cysteine synthase family protein [Marinobacter salinisoli]QSP95485.1 PLP-dependent cysteine synthase family protein [Marinobacter salinisoli]
MEQNWINHAIAAIEADFRRSSDTHLLKVDLPACGDITLYLKDESTHPTGSLKHRLARSLFLYGLCNGQIHQGTPIIEASSGSTAISEAYFAKLLGLPFIAVIPKGTSQEKIDKIAFYGGRCHLVEACDIYSEAARLAEEVGGHYMDQFTFAERATDWRGNNNIAESIFQQMSAEPHPVPDWIVVSAGTGGTSATIGRYIRYQGHPTRLCVADPDNSVFFDYFQTGDASLTTGQRSMIEGIGRPRVEPSFVASVIDRMSKVPDSAAFATIHVLEKMLGRRCGGSTGTNVYAALQIISDMVARNESGSVVSMICDGGERYLDSYYNDQWLADNGFDTESYRKQLEHFFETGVFKPVR